MRHIVLALALFFGTAAFAADPEPTDAPAVEATDAQPADAAEAKDADAKEEPKEDPKEEPKEEPAKPDAEEIEAVVDGVADQGEFIANAIQNKDWALLAGFLLSLLVAFANRFGLKDKVGGAAVPWVTSGIAVVGAVGASLMAGLPVLEAVSQGLVAGVAAIGGWEMILKHLMGGKTEEIEEAEAKAEA